MIANRLVFAATLGFVLVSGTTAAQAEDTGNPPDWCRNGAFALSQDNLKLAHVGKHATPVLLDSGQKKGCPQAGARCSLGGDAAKAGSEILFNNELPGFVCAYMPAQDGDGGWVAKSDVAVEQPQPSAKPPASAWLGKWKHGDTEIDVVAKGTQLGLSGDAASAQGNEGSFDSKTSPKANKLHITDNAPCELWMTLAGNYLVVRDNQQCGGMNVSFTGVYTRAKK